MLFKLRLKKDSKEEGLLGYDSITVLSVEPEGMTEVEDRCHAMGISYKKGNMFKWAVTNYYTCLVDEGRIVRIVDQDFWHDVDELELYEADSDWLGKMQGGC